MNEIKVGDTVQLLYANGRRSKDTAEVVEIRDDVPLGIRVSRPLVGFVYWGWDDLVVVDEEE